MVISEKMPWNENMGFKNGFWVWSGREEWVRSRREEWVWWVQSRREKRAFGVIDNFRVCREWESACLGWVLWGVWAFLSRWLKQKTTPLGLISMNKRRVHWTWFLLRKASPLDSISIGKKQLLWAWVLWIKNEYIVHDFNEQKTTPLDSIFGLRGHFVQFSCWRKRKSSTIYSIYNPKIESSGLDLLETKLVSNLG